MRVKWKHVNAAGAIGSMLLWGVVEFTGGITSVALVNRVSLFTMAVTFLAGWRADKPTEEEHL